METETKTPTLIHAETADLFTIVVQGKSLTATRSELQAVVQAAYDQHGIIAEPSIEVERATYEARQDEAEDAHLRTFADAWGRSVRGDRAW